MSELVREKLKQFASIYKQKYNKNFFQTKIYWDRETLGQRLPAQRTPTELSVCTVYAQPRSKKNLVSAPK